MLKTVDIFFILVALGLFFWGVRKRMRFWSLGTETDRSGQIGAKTKSLFIEGILHKRILQDKYPGLLHLFAFLGFLLPLVVVIFTQAMFTLPPILAGLLSLSLDILAFLAIVSVALFIYRRYKTRPERLDNRREDLTVLLLILAILLTGLLMESLRLAVVGRDVLAWAPIGRVVSGLIQLFGFSLHSLSAAAMVVFRIHLFLVLVTVAYIPFSKMFHVVASPLNMFFRSRQPQGVLSFIDLEDEKAESFGVSTLQEFTWKQLMDLDACTRCGRCQDHCPAYLTDKPLSPKKFILDLKDHMEIQAPKILKGTKEGEDRTDQPNLVKDVIGEDTLWACTTCRSCMEHCPVYVEHVDKIVDIRRSQVLMESQFPEELMTAFRGLEKNSNPWGLGFDARVDWIQEMNVPLMADCQGEELDYLFYVGCIRSYDDRNKKVALAMARILNHLGTKFAILGMEEGCCGDPARRVGNEYLYQILAQKNIETLQRYKIKRILTTCPHCFNTLKFEYPQLGFQAEVEHHSTFLLEQIRSGRLRMEFPQNKKLTYHDPCYLGRYSGIFDPPREVIRSIPSAQLTEMERTRKDSLCCGAGGGWMWMDEKIGKRINIQRLEDALTVDPEWIATACPFCVTMFSDAIKDLEREETVKIWDIAELVALGLFGESD